jgi:hypothetical protein
MAAGEEEVHLHSFLTSALDMVSGQRNNPAPAPPLPFPNKLEARWTKEAVWTLRGKGNLLPLLGLE